MAIRTDVRIAIPLIQERSVNHISRQAAIRQIPDLQSDDCRTKDRADPQHGLQIDHPLDDPGQAGQ
jgi:hypothetical protein